VRDVWKLHPSVLAILLLLRDGGCSNGTKLQAACEALLKEKHND